MDRFFHEELEGLRSDLVLMGRKSVDNVRLALRALVENDMSLVDKVIESDDEVDELNLKIDGDAIRYITLRAPVARDVRLLTVAMKCSRELERTSDEACSIGKRARKMSAEGPFKDFLVVPRMAEMAIKMLDDALDSFIQEKPEIAKDIPKRDKEVDVLNREVFESLNDLILANPGESTTPAVSLMFIAKSIERVGDHACNIAEEVYYLLRSEDIRHTDDVKRSLM